MVPPSEKAGNSHAHALAVHSRNALAIDFALNPLSRFSSREGITDDRDTTLDPVVLDVGPVAYCGFTTPHHQQHYQHCPALFANTGGRLNSQSHTSIGQSRKPHKASSMKLIELKQHGHGSSGLRSDSNFTESSTILEAAELAAPETLPDLTKLFHGIPSDNNKLVSSTKSDSLFQQRIAAGGLTFEHTVDPNVLIAVVFLQKFGPMQSLNFETIQFCSNVSSSLSVALHKVAQNLKVRGISSVSSIENKVNSARDTVFRTANVIQDRTNIKPPFWQLCNTDDLQHVLQRVYS